MLLAQLSSINDFYSMWLMTESHYRYSEVFFQRHAFAFFETRFLKKVYILRYLHNSNTKAPK